MGQVNSLLAKVVDNLNVGRIIFYLTSGLPVSAVLFMVASALFREQEQTIRASMMADFELVTRNVHFYLFISYIAGFMISLFAFSSIDKLQRFYSRGYSVTRNLKVLCEGKRDYLDTFLIPEYYRYVEAAVFIPQGLLAGAYGFILYALINIFARGDVWIDILLIALLTVLLFHVTYHFWHHRVIRSIVKFYMESKARVIEGLGGYK
ncbi:MAG: hypothetical protein AAGB13_07050 [Cyanobacteria bacterium P01_F01_bin.33]